jgi:bifunctional non-homologous end joining protein LigD
VTKIDVDGHEIEIKRPDKVLFPRDGITKLELAEYYASIGKTLLPHVRERPLSVQRYPDGIDGFMFFQKSVPKYYPEWIDSVEVPKKGGTVKHVVVNNTATLVYLANQAAITPHVSPARADDLMHPDRLIFDLDPPDEGAFDVARETAKTIREIFEEIGLVSFVMTTGSKGLHVVAPIERNDTFEKVVVVADGIAQLVLQREPDRCTTEFTIAKRGGRLYLDTRRNAYGQHAVAAYGVRAKPGAPVATPLEWDDLDDRKLTASKYTLRTIGKRLDAHPDPWKEISKHARSLEAPKRAIQKLLASD